MKRFFSDMILCKKFRDIQTLGSVAEVGDSWCLQKVIRMHSLSLVINQKKRFCASCNLLDSWCCGCHSNDVSDVALCFHAADWIQRNICLSGDYLHGLLGHNGGFEFCSSEILCRRELTM